MPKPYQQTLRETWEIIEDYRSSSGNFLLTEPGISSLCALEQHLACAVAIAYNKTPGEVVQDWTKIRKLTPFNESKENSSLLEKLKSIFSDKA